VTKTKQPKYPKIIHFNTPRAKTFSVNNLGSSTVVWNTSCQTKRRQHFWFEHGQDNGLALGKVDSSKALDDAGQPKNGVSDQLINLLLKKFVC
jgi:hypothetical protein